MHFSWWETPAARWASLRERMKAEALEDQNTQGHRNNGYSRCLLHGFARRDRVLKHIRDAHKDIDTTADDFSIERDTLVGEPILAESQSFWYLYLDNYWFGTNLARLQRIDGSWTEWFGQEQAQIAAIGFHLWTEVEEKNYDRLRILKGYNNVLPWEAAAFLQKLNLPVDQESGQVVSHSQVGPASTEPSDPYKEVSLHDGAEDLQDLSTPLWFTHAAVPENFTGPLSDFFIGYDADAPHSRSLDVSASAPAFSITPGHSGGTLSTDDGVFTPKYHFGEALPTNMLTSLNAAPAIIASGNEQSGNVWSEYLSSDGFDSGLPALPWVDGGFGTEYLFNDGLKFDMGDFGAVPQSQPEEVAYHGADEPEDEKEEYAGLGKRRFSQL